MKKRIKSTLVILSLILTTLLISCKTCPTNVNPKDLTWTPVPNPIIDGQPAVTLDVDTETVYVRYEYWKALMNYIIDMETNVQILTQ